MFVTVFTYRARAGEEESLKRLHEEWQQDRWARTKGFLSAELLRSSKDPQAFIYIARFDREVALQVETGDPEGDTLYRRLVSLTESEPIFTDWRVAWQTTHNSRGKTAPGL
jgi:hypothetical protein